MVEGTREMALKIYKRHTGSYRQHPWQRLSIDAAPCGGLQSASGEYRKHERTFLTLMQ